MQFEHVQFGYRPDHILIHDLNIDVHAGQTVAIVGPTGAGKTTIINLLLRFYDVNSGSIKVDGVDIRDMRREDLRSILLAWCCRIPGCLAAPSWKISATAS